MRPGYPPEPEGCARPTANGEKAVDRRSNALSTALLTHLRDAGAQPRPPDSTIITAPATITSDPRRRFRMLLS